MEIEIRPARLEDLPGLERRCWRGGEDAMQARIAAQGTVMLGCWPVGRVRATEHRKVQQLTRERLIGATSA